MKDKRIVKIKTWNKMVEEFGLISMNSIDCENFFNDDMEEAMPKNRIIVITKSIDDIYYWNGWIISDDMIEEEYSRKIHPQYFI